MWRSWRQSASSPRGVSAGLDHRRIRRHPGEEPLDHALALGDAEKGGEAILELRHLELAALELPQEVESLAALPEQLPHGLRLEPLALAERAERLEDVRRQNAAEVDEQPPHVRGAGSFVIWCAASASCGTPLSNSAR